MQTPRRTRRSEERRAHRTADLTMNSAAAEQASPLLHAIMALEVKATALTAGEVLAEAISGTIAANPGATLTVALEATLTTDHAHQRTDRPITWSTV